MSQNNKVYIFEWECYGYQGIGMCDHDCREFNDTTMSHPHPLSPTTVMMITMETLHTNFIKLNTKGSPVSAFHTWIKVYYYILKITI